MEAGQKNKKIWYLRLFQISVVVSSVWGEDAVFYKFANLAIFLFFLSGIWFIVRNKWKIRFGNGYKISLLFFAYTTVSLLWSQNKDVAFHQYITQFQLYLLITFVYAILDHNEMKYYLDALYVAGFIMILYALYVYGGFNSFVGMMNSGRRLGGEIANENSFGLVFSHAALVALYYAIMRQKRIHLASVALFTFFAMSSGSRKAAFMIFIGAIGISILYYGVRKVYKYIFVFLGVVVMAYFLLQMPIFNVVNERLSASFSDEVDESTEIRNDMIDKAFEMFQEKPILGYGLYNFGVYYYGTYSHNNFTELLVSLGIIGAILYYLMFVFPLIRFYEKDKYLTGNDKFQNQMLIFFILTEIVFGWRMVQFYSKSSMFLIGVVLAVCDSMYNMKIANGENHVQVGSSSETDKS